MFCTNQFSVSTLDVLPILTVSLSPQTLPENRETVCNSSVVQETQGEEEASGQAGGIRQTYRDIRKLLHATVQAPSLP